MAPSSKATDGRRKSGGNNHSTAAANNQKASSWTITLTVSPDKLKEIIDPQPTQENSPAKDDEMEDVKDTQESHESPATSATLQAQANGETASDSNPATPAAGGTPGPAAMGPPTEGVKKKGVKRSSTAANGNGADGLPKIRGKPGPKKKQRLEDGTLDPNGTTGRAGGAGGHKLGPKANQGAINAGLRALDRSGKPCRKWARNGFTLKSFTGVVWEIPRWTAPPKTVPESATEESADASAENSSKENQDNTQIKSDAPSNGNSVPDPEMRSVASVPASSPAPMAIAAA